MAIHIAILKRVYASAILAGTKTVESRLTRVAMPPYRVVEAGQRIYIKVSAGPFVAVARALEVVHLSDLTPDRVDALRRRYEKSVGGGDDYWHAKRESRFASFITLAGVEPIDVGPAYTKSLRAWHVVADECDPVRDVTLTAGAIRNNYVSLPPRGAAADEAHSLTLQLPDGAQIQTERTSSHMLRWRGWRAYFAAWGARPGGRVRFVALGRGRYRVSYHPSRSETP